MKLKAEQWIKNNIKKLGSQNKKYKDIAETHTQNLGKLFNSCSNRGTYLDDCMEISYTKPIHDNTLRHLKIYSQEILKNYWYRCKVKIDNKFHK
jgi:hypothetical protein